VVKEWGDAGSSRQTGRVSRSARPLRRQPNSLFLSFHRTLPNAGIVNGFRMSHVRVRNKAGANPFHTVDSFVGFAHHPGCLVMRLAACWVDWP
jgi:hypothetical protein